MAAAELAGFWAAVAAYALAFVTTACGLVLGRPFWVRTGWWLAAVGFAAQAVALAGRGLAAGAPPFVSYYESVLFGTWLAAGGVLGVTRRRSAPTGILLAAAPVILLLLGSAVFTSRDFERLGPSLQSWWLVVHVTFALLAFAAALVAAGAGAVILAVPAAAASPVVSRGMALAFLFQMVMVVSGAIWARQAWGRYWGWDPIESCSLLTLLVFGIGLHLERLHGWRGRTLAGIAVAGFLITAFGIWGVPFFLPSGHLYQGPRGSGGG